MAMIHFANGEVIQVSETIDEVAQKIASVEAQGPVLLVKLARPAVSAQDEWVNVAHVIRITEQ
jgi:hypothetical protein